MATRREHRSGSIHWLKGSNTKAQLRYRDGPDGARKRFSKVVTVASKNHGGRGEAADELAKFIEECEDSLKPKPTSITLAQLMTKYVKHIERIGRAQSTVERYEGIAGQIPDDIGAIPLADLTASDLDRLYGELSPRLGANTIRIQHGVMHGAFEQAIKWGLIEVNPATKATPPLKVERNDKPLPPADVYRMINTALVPKGDEEYGDVVLAMSIVMAVLTGCRRGELSGLRWDDINAETCCIRVERQWIPGKGGQYLKPATKSRRGQRDIFLGDLGLLQIDRYRNLLRAILEREPEGWLLSYDAGTTPMSAKGLGDGIRDLAKRCDLKVTTHSFRKVQATQLMAAGVDADTGARRMGHTTEIMLSDYVLGADDKSIAAAGLVEARLVERGLPIGSLLELPKETAE